MRVLYTASRKASRVRRERLGAAGPRGHGAVSRGFNSPWVGEEPLESSFTSGNCRGIGVGPRKCWALRGWGNFNTTFEKSLNHLNFVKGSFSVSLLGGTTCQCRGWLAPFHIPPDSNQNLRENPHRRNFSRHVHLNPLFRKYCLRQGHSAPQLPSSLFVSSLLAEAPQHCHNEAPHDVPLERHLATGVSWRHGQGLPAQNT